MTTYSAVGLSGRDINDIIRRERDDDITFTHVNGQRFIADAMKDKTVTVEGIAGNASGAYMDGGKLIVRGNAQDAIGDTMNGGEIFISGMCGDAAGYAMRGGEIYIGKDVGYRAGIHMKEYGSDKPVLVIGGVAGDYLGEYQAGGLIIVVNTEGVANPLGDDYATGMHGGKIVVFTDCEPKPLGGARVRRAESGDIDELAAYIDKFCALTSREYYDIVSRTAWIIEPAGRNPYKRLYVNN